MELQVIQTKIHTIHGERVMFDFDLAERYEVETKVLKWLGEENQARADEIKALETDNENPDDWQNRPRIGFKE